MYTCVFYLQMAKGYDHFDVHFQDILNNLNIKLIASWLATSGIISADDQAQLERKCGKRSAVKFVLRKVRNHDNGNVLFKKCLINTCDSQGHQNLVSILYSSKDTSLDCYKFYILYVGG